MNAALVLSRVVERYTSVTSYRDTGKVSFVVGSTESVAADFTTHFSRTSGLSFEFRFTRGSPSTPIKAFRTDLQSVIEAKGFLQASKSIPGAVAAVTGTTFGVAHTVPKLLWPNVIRGRGLDVALEHAQLLESQLVATDPCFVLDAKKENRHELVFIRERDFALVRLVLNQTASVPALERVREHLGTAGMPVLEPMTTTITYEPHLNPA